MPKIRLKMGKERGEGVEAPLPDAENPAEELASYKTVQRGEKKLGRCMYPVSSSRKSGYSIQDGLLKI